MSWRSALRPLSRTSPRTRCSVSTSSRTSSRPGCPQSRSTVEQALQEAQRAEVVELAAHSRRPAGGGGHRALSTEPRDERLGSGGVTGEPGVSVAAQRRREGRGRPGDRGEPLLHQLVDGGDEPVRVVLVDLPGVEHPGLDDAARWAVYQDNAFTLFSW